MENMNTTAARLEAQLASIQNSISKHQTAISNGASKSYHSREILLLNKIAAKKEQQLAEINA